METLTLLTAEDVARRIADLSVDAITAALRVAFAGLRDGVTVQPPQTITVLPGQAGDCIFYPAALWGARLIGVKASPYLADRAARGLSPVTAYTLLLSAEDGTPLLLCDSLALTAVRTAATTALALDSLAPRGARRLAIVGAGPLAQEHLRFARAARTWTSIQVYAPSTADPTSARGVMRREQIRSIAPEALFAGDAQSCVAGADVVLLCTSSATPVIDLAWLAPSAVVTSIATNAPRAHEVAPEALAELRVFCDYRVTAPVTAGDMIIAQERHGWSPQAIVADLPEIVMAPTDQWAGVGRTYFRSTGLGIEDLAVAGLLLEAQRGN